MADDFTIKIKDAQVLEALEGLREALGGSISVEVGTNVVYGAIHQFGGAAGRKDRRVTIPARPFHGVSNEDRTELLAIINDHLQRAWGGEHLTGADAARAIGRISRAARSSASARRRGRMARPGRRASVCSRAAADKPCGSQAVCETRLPISAVSIIRCAPDARVIGVDGPSPARVQEESRTIE